MGRKLKAFKCPKCLTFQSTWKSCEWCGNPRRKMRLVKVSLRRYCSIFGHIPGKRTGETWDDQAQSIPVYRCRRCKKNPGWC